MRFFYGWWEIMWLHLSKTLKKKQQNFLKSLHIQRVWARLFFKISFFLLLFFFLCVCFISSLFEKSHSFNILCISRRPHKILPHTPRVFHFDREFSSGPCLFGFTDPFDGERSQSVTSAVRSAAAGDVRNPVTLSLPVKGLLESDMRLLHSCHSQQNILLLFVCLQQV